MGKKKVNPNRRPATGADVEKARREGTDTGMERALMLVLYVLIDQHQAPKEDVQALAEEVNDMAWRVSHGKVTWGMIEKALLTDYELTIQLR